MKIQAKVEKSAVSFSKKAHAVCRETHRRVKIPFDPTASKATGTALAERQPEHRH